MAGKVTEWSLKLRENIAPGMDKVGRSVSNAFTKMQQMQKQLDQNSQKSKQFDRSIGDLNKHLDGLKKKREITVDYSELERLNKEIDRTEKKLDKLETHGMKPSRWSMQNLKESASQIPGASGLMAIANNPYLLGASAATATGKFLYESGKTRLNYDKKFAQINATAQLDDAGLAKLRSDIMLDGRNSSTELERVPEAYEKILSATNNVKLSQDILRKSLLGAQAGFADVNEVASATVGIMNTVGSKNTNAGEVLDVLFSAKRTGVGEFKDFAQYLPSVITQGTSLGYNYKDVSGAYSYLTTKGNSADRSATLMSNLFTSLSRPEVIADLKKYGVNTYNKDGSRKDLFSIFTQLDAKLSGLTQKQRDNMLGDIVKDAQAKEAFNSLTKDVDTLGKIMRDAANSSGELKAALDKTKNGLNDLQQLDNNWEAFKDNVGKAVAPALVEMFKSWNAGLDGVIAHREFVSMSSDEQLKYRSKEYMYDVRTGRKEDLDGQIDGNKAGLGILLKNKGFASGQWKGGEYTNDMLNKEIQYYTSLATLDISKVPAKQRKAAFAMKYGLSAEEMKGWGGENATTTETPKPSNTVTSTMDNITGGGSIKNFTVNIGKFQDQTVIQPQTLTEGASEAEKILFDMMIRIVQGVELAAGNN